MMFVIFTAFKRLLKVLHLFFFKLINSKCLGWVFEIYFLRFMAINVLEDSFPRNR